MLSVQRYTSHIIAVIIVAVCVSVGLIYINSSRAATPLINLEPEDGSISAPAALLGDGSASKANSVVFSQQSTAPGLPTATNTGVQPGAQLTDIYLSTIQNVSGQTFRNVRVINNVSSYDGITGFIYGSNNTFINARFVQLFKGNFVGFDLVVAGGSNNSFDYSEFGKLSISGAKQITIKNSKSINAFGKDALGISSDTGRAQDILIDNFYAFGNSADITASENHYDTLQVRGVDNLTVRNMVADHGSGGFNTIYNATVYLENANGGNNTVVLENIYSRSLGYFHLYLFATNLTVKNMTFARPVSGSTTKVFYGGTMPFTQSGNRWLESNGAYTPMTIQPGI